MRWAGNVACVGRGEVCVGFWWGNLMERDHFEDSDIDWRMMLKLIFRKWDVRGVGGVSTDRIDLAQNRDSWRVVVSFRKCGEFLD